MKAMTPEEWFNSDLCKNDNLWLNIEDYVNYVLNIAAEKAEVNVIDYNDYEVDKGSILNCLKD